MNFSASILLSMLCCIHGQQEKTSIPALRGSQLSNLESLEASNKFEVIPPHFWTDSNSRGNGYGWGTAEGEKYVTLKGRLGYVSLDTLGGEQAKANRDSNGPWEKFKVEFLGGNKVAFKGWNGKYMCCHQGWIVVNRTRRGEWETFTVYKTSSKGSGLPEGNDYIAIRGVNGFLTVETDGKVTCNRGEARTWEKFSGWMNSVPWVVDKVEFDIKNGIKGGNKPKGLGRIVNDNRQGSITRVTSKEITETVTETSFFSNAVGVGIEVGTTFSTGVPFIAKGEISVTVSASYEHTWGGETTREKSYTDTIHCESPPRTKTLCEYVANTATMDVPYKMNVSQGSYRTKVVEGTWKGVSVFEDHMTFTEIKTDEIEFENITSEVGIDLDYDESEKHGIDKSAEEGIEDKNNMFVIS